MDERIDSEDIGGVQRLRNAQADLTGVVTRERLTSVWVSYLSPLQPEEFSRDEGQEFSALREKAGHLDELLDTEVAEVGRRSLEFVTAVLSRIG